MTDLQRLEIARSKANKLWKLYQLRLQELKERVK